MVGFVPVTGESSPLFPDVRRIYEASFPVEEQRGPGQQQYAWDDPGYVLSALVQDGIVVGLLGEWELDGCFFIEHFALSPGVRGKGLGSGVLGEYLEKRDGKPVVLEVELLADDISRRRAAFYERAGFILTEHLHTQPPFRKGGKVLSLRIMSYLRELARNEYERFNEEYRERVMGAEEEM